MKYGTIDLEARKGTLRIVKTKSQLVDHYPGTDKVRYSDLGRDATRIIVTLLANDDAERILIEQIMHTDVMEDLEIKDIKYKDVVTGGVHSMIHTNNEKTRWEIECEFIATDPIPYSVTTGEALY